MKSVLLSLAVLAAIVMTPKVWDVSSAHASGPCQNAGADPDPPIGQPDLVIGGRVTLNSTSAVEGATVKLFWCDGSTAVQAAGTETGSNGDYEFTSELVEGKWHYVAVALTGPLTGASPAVGTNNPSPLIAVGYGDDDVGFDFEN